MASTSIVAFYDLLVCYWRFSRWYFYIFTIKMITALIIYHLLLFPTPIYRDPSGAQEIALTQWGEAWIGAAHKEKAGSSFYDTIFKEDTKILILIDYEWVEYEVVESGVFRCETPRPNCNNATFRRMYEPGAVILATCWPRGGEALGQFIIKMLPTLDTMSAMVYTSVHENTAQKNHR